jgi:hypothetical protein
MESTSEPARMPEAPGAGVTNALRDHIEIDFNSMQQPQSLKTEASHIHTDVLWIPDVRCPSCHLTRRTVRFEPFGREILQCPDCDRCRLDGDDLMEAAIVLLSLPILISIAFLALHIQ